MERSGVLTIGYERRGVDQLTVVLRECGVNVLADVRLNAVSRKSGFGRRALAARLDAAGIAYRHYPALGNPVEGRAPFRSGDLERGREVYRGHLRADAARSALDELVALCGDSVVALLCYERDPECCHRQVVAEVVERRTGLVARHIT